MRDRRLVLPEPDAPQIKRPDVGMEGCAAEARERPRLLTSVYRMWAKLFVRCFSMPVRVSEGLIVEVSSSSEDARACAFSGGLGTGVGRGSPMRTSAHAIGASPEPKAVRVALSMCMLPSGTFEEPLRWTLIQAWCIDASPASPSWSRAFCLPLLPPPDCLAGS